MPRYEVRVVTPESQVLDRFGLSRLASELASNDTGDPLDLVSLAITRMGANKFSVHYDRTHHMVTEAESSLVALRSFLHLTDLPGNVDHTKIVVRLEEDPPAIAAVGPIVPRQVPVSTDMLGSRVGT